MNDPSDASANNEDLLHDLELEYVEMAGKGDCDAVTFAILESDSFMSVLTGVAMSILKNKAPGHKTLMEGLYMHAAPKWAAQELPRRIASMKEMRDDWDDEQAVKYEETQS